jgi:primosomal protein N' (replication factor Y)
MRCPRCDVPLVYHRQASARRGEPLDGDQSRLVCHRCSRRYADPGSCPACGDTAIRHLGVGTERVEEELLKRFPGARVARSDRDATRAGQQDAALWERFRGGEIDVLVGTQLVTKALDFPRVTVVGVVLADIGLYLPDLRAAERTFQLLTQVAGRAGRAEHPGKVVIQTYSPEHYAIRAAAGHDYEAFYRRELAFRFEQGYPPYGRLIRFVYAHASEARCEAEALALRQQLNQRLETLASPELRLIGPAPCYLQRIRGRSRWHLLACGPRPELLLDGLTLPHGWIVDVDPVTML